MHLQRKAKANYGDGQIPNYDELRKNHIRTEQILSCSSFNIKTLDLKKTVNLFCKDPTQNLML